MTYSNSELILLIECTGSEKILSYSQNIHPRASKLCPCSGERYGHGPVDPAPAPQVHSRVRHLIHALLTLLFLQAIDESQRHFIPLFRQQHQQKAEADDDGGGQADNVEYHLLFQEIHS